MPQYSEDARTRASLATARTTLELKRTVHAPGEARAAVMGRCDQLELDGSLAQSLILLVSEVVSNAVRHSSGDADSPIELVAEFGAERIRVTVTDAGAGFVPRPRDPGSTRDGYGLYLLEKVATSWGVDSQGDTKVWFELPRGG
ncbi:MAG TPA: ATP-binding protein [Solirubrobacteraceae bacterium]|jgi:anti-sigma regulatory factor (Ser/Thr protein kinase)|nr:ATP-binding protein [Solirubrobacteraceae bacterium]